MTCEQARERSAADLLGELDETGRRELAAHHATCAICRAEADADRANWRRLGELPAPVWSEAARARSWRALHDAARTVNSPVRRTRPWPIAASIAAAFLLGLLVPAPLRPWQRTTRAGDIVPDTLPRFVLLFTEARHDALPPAAPGLQVREMVRWVDSLAERSRFLGGEKLVEDRGVVLTAAGQSPYAPAEHVTGFIIVRANSEAEALAIARQSPVLRSGGAVVVLPVDPI